MGRVELGRRRLLGRVACGPVLVLLVLGLLSVALVATLPPPPEADLADHSGARGRRATWYVSGLRPLSRAELSRAGRACPAELHLALAELPSRPLDLPADAELMAQAAPGGRRAPDTSTDESCDLARKRQHGRCLTSHEHRLSPEAGLTSSMRSGGPLASVLQPLARFCATGFFCRFWSLHRQHTCSQSEAIIALRSCTPRASALVHQYSVHSTIQQHALPAAPLANPLGRHADAAEIDAHHLPLHRATRRLTGVARGASDASRDARRRHLSLAAALQPNLSICSETAAGCS